MKLSIRPLIVLLLVVSGGSFWAARASQLALPQTRRIPKFENDEVKVWKSVVMPNSPLPLHRPSLAYGVSMEPL